MMKDQHLSLKRAPCCCAVDVGSRCSAAEVYKDCIVVYFAPSPWWVLGILAYCLTFSYRELEIYSVLRIQYIVFSTS